MHTQSPEMKEKDALIETNIVSSNHELSDEIGIARILDYVAKLVQFIHDSAHPEEAPLMSGFKDVDRLKAQIVKEAHIFVEQEAQINTTDSKAIRIEKILGTKTMQDFFALIARYDEKRTLIPDEVYEQFARRKIIEQQLIMQSSESYQDAKTGLFNGEFLKNYIPSALNDVEKNGGKLTLVSIDINNFHNINHHFGHETGDELLRAIGQRLQETLRKSDIVSLRGQKLIRAYGKQFLIVSSVANKEDVAILAQKILEGFRAPFALEQEEDATNDAHFTPSILTPSIGVSVYPDDGKDYDALLKKAEIAMYSAKKAGGNVFEVYTSKMSADLTAEIELEAGILHALENNEFELYYQPQIDLSNDTLAWVEALIRWNHPEKWLLSPGHFIDFVNKKEQLTNRLWKWVFTAACKQAVLWKERGFNAKIWVNFSAGLFSNKDIVKEMEAILAETWADPAYIELEVVEWALENIEETASILEKFKEIGFHISIDDFWTGYSSFGHILRFPIDTIKIDKYFVDTINDPNLRHHGINLLAGMIDLGHRLKKRMLVEWVETAEQKTLLIWAGCDLIQGYFYDKPLRLADLEAKYWKTE